MSSIYDFTATLLTGAETPLAEYRGDVMLIVNTASKCGFTPQYEGLQKLYETYEPQGLEILGFPCNQFGNQEPGDAGEIGAFCAKNYGVTFPMFARVDVNGANTHPLFAWLKRERPGLLGSQAIKWNFTKFLVDRDGKATARHATTTPPAALAAEIQTLLGAR